MDVVIPKSSAGDTGVKAQRALSYDTVADNETPPTSSSS